MSTSDDFERVWRRLAASSEGLDQEAAQAGIDRTALAHKLAARAAADERRVGRSWAARHWPDLALAGALVGAVTLGVHAMRVGYAPPVDGTVVVARRDLGAYERVRAADVVVTRARAGPDAYRSVAQVTGRYALTPIAAGATLAARALSGVSIGDSAASGRRVLSVAARAHDSEFAVRPGEQVALVASLRGSAGALTGGAVVEDVLVLAVTYGARDSARLVVAVPGEALPTLASYLGEGSIHIVRLWR